MQPSCQDVNNTLEQSHVFLFNIFEQSHVFLFNISLHNVMVEKYDIASLPVIQWCKSLGVLVKKISKLIQWESSHSHIRCIVIFLSHFYEKGASYVLSNTVNTKTIRWNTEGVRVTTAMLSGRPRVSRFSRNLSS